MRSRLCASVLACSVSLLLAMPFTGAQVVSPGASGAASPTAGKTPPAYAADPKFQAAISEATELARHRQFGFAADSYKKANKIAGGQCMDCLRGLYDADLKSGNFNDAANSAQAMEALSTAPASKALAEFRRAQSLLFAAGDKPKPDKLEAIHGILLESIGNYPKNPSALFLDGKVMAQMGKMDAAKADFTQCLSCVGPKDPARLRAEHFAEDPELALHKMAPPFEVVALDGSRFNLDAMGGRVVLIDFWATWCGPCNRELPHMKEIAKKFAGQPLTIISVSWDQDEAKWKDFVAKNDMTWVQYRDADHHLAELFGINAIPHYFTIDSDGVLTSEMLGEGANVEGKLKKLLARAQEAQKETVAAAAPASLGTR